MFSKGDLQKCYSILLNRKMPLVINCIELLHMVRLLRTNLDVVEIDPIKLKASQFFSKPHKM